MTVVIGLTGGIASGKSTVASILIEKGITVIDADIEARLAVQPGEEAYASIISHFGNGILQKDGQIDREKLGSIIFHNEEQRLKLNGFVHPAVRRRMIEKRDRAIQNGEKLAVMDIPLLFESGLEHLVDKTLLVYVSEETQLGRLMKRNGLSKEEAAARINSQMPLKAKKALADAFIDNNGTIEQTIDQLMGILQKWNAL